MSLLRIYSCTIIIAPPLTVSRSSPRSVVTYICCSALQVIVEFLRPLVSTLWEQTLFISQINRISQWFKMVWLQLCQFLLMMYFSTKYHLLSNFRMSLALIVYIKLTQQSALFYLSAAHLVRLRGVESPRSPARSCRARHGPRSRAVSPLAVPGPAKDNMTISSHELHLFGSFRGQSLTNVLFS